MKRVGLAERTLRRWRERRIEVDCELSLEAAMLMHWMFCTPNVQWKREDQYEPADKLAERDCARIAKFTDKRLLSEERLPDGEVAIKTLDDLKAAYAPDAPDVKKVEAWRRARVVLGREYQPGTYKLRAESIDRIKAVLDHYRKKKSAAYLVNHFAELEAALDGKPLPQAEDIEEAA